MKLRYPKLKRKNLKQITENMKQAKQYVQSGKLSREQLKALSDIDPTEKNKYVGWLAKVVVKENPNISELRSAIEEYHQYVKDNKTDKKDIFQFKTYSDFMDHLQVLHDTGANISVADLERDYETWQKDNNLTIMVPHSHEASRKLGLSEFVYRDCGDGTKDSAWCTTYKAPNHFNAYYYENNITFYYLKINDEELIDIVKEQFGPQFVVMAITVYPPDFSEASPRAIKNKKGNQITAFDGNDEEHAGNTLREYFQTIKPYIKLNIKK